MLENTKARGSNSETSFQPNFSNKTTSVAEHNSLPNSTSLPHFPEGFNEVNEVKKLGIIPRATEVV
jgi:hypothetical protein